MVDFKKVLTIINSIKTKADVLFMVDEKLIVINSDEYFEAKFPFGFNQSVCLNKSKFYKVFKSTNVLECELAKDVVKFYTDEGTIEFWVKPDWTISDPRQHRFFEIQHNLDFYGFALFKRNDSARITFRYYNGTFAFSDGIDIEDDGKMTIGQV